MHLPTEKWAYKIQTPGNYPEESIQRSEHGKSLKSRLFLAVAIMFTNICENNGDYWHVGCSRTGSHNVMW